MGGMCCGSRLAPNSEECAPIRYKELDDAASSEADQDDLARASTCLPCGPCGMGFDDDSLTDRMQTTMDQLKQDPEVAALLKKATFGNDFKTNQPKKPPEDIGEDNPDLNMDLTAVWSDEWEEGKTLSFEEWKECGNRFLKMKDYSSALTCYSNVMEAIWKKRQGTSLDDPEIRAIMTAALNNRSLVKFELGNMEGAYDDALKSISLSGGENEKAHFRRGRACIALEKWKEAYDAFNQCHVLADKLCKERDKSIDKLILQCERKIPKWQRKG